MTLLVCGERICFLKIYFLALNVQTDKTKFLLLMVGEGLVSMS